MTTSLLGSVLPFVLTVDLQQFGDIDAGVDHHSEAFRRRVSPPAVEDNKQRPEIREDEGSGMLCGLPSDVCELWNAVDEVIETELLLLENSCQPLL